MPLDGAYPAELFELIRLTPMSTTTVFMPLSHAQELAKFASAKFCKLASAPVQENVCLFRRSSGACNAITRLSSISPLLPVRSVGW